MVPEFSTISFCRPQRSFGLRFIVIVRPVSDLFLRGVRVVFVDRFGRRAFPTAGVFTTGSGLPSNAGPITFPSTSPIPIPTTPASTIPIPGPSGFDPLLIHGGRSQSLPIFLEFGCGIPSSGTVFVNVETSDRNGRSRHSELRVAVQD